MRPDLNAPGWATHPATGHPPTGASTCEEAELAAIAILCLAFAWPEAKPVPRPHSA